MTPRRRNILVSSAVIVASLVAANLLVTFLGLPSFIVFIVIFVVAGAMRYLFPSRPSLPQEPPR